MSELTLPTVAALENPFGSSPGFIPECELCAEIWDSHALSAHLGLYRSRDEKILLESEGFLVIPDISPLVPGHRLIVTRNHVPSLAELPEHLYDELEEIQTRAIYELKASRADGNCLSVILFEHGGFAGETGAGDCINHAHLHIVPLAQSSGGLPPLSEWLEDHGEIVEIDRLRDMAATVRAQAKGYLFCQDGKGCRLLVSNLDYPVPCQYMRRMLATHLHVEEWNWKIAFGRDRRDPKTGAR